MLASITNACMLRPSYHQPIGQRRNCAVSLSKFPRDFLAHAATLNLRDQEIEMSNYKSHLKGVLPTEHHEAVQNMRSYEALFELYMTMILYEKPPLKPQQKIHVRNTIQHLLRTSSWADDEISVFEYIINHFDCLN